MELFIYILIGVFILPLLPILLYKLLYKLFYFFEFKKLNCTKLEDEKNEKN